MKNFKRSLCCLFILCLVALTLSACKTVFKIEEHMDSVIVTVNTSDVKLSEVMYYIMIVERNVEEQALVYNPNNPLSYWNIHTNGVFLSLLAKEKALDQVIRTEILCQLTSQNNFTLTEDEKSTIKSNASDTFFDMNSYELKVTQLTAERIEEVLTKLTIAEKYARILMTDNDLSFADVNLEGSYYENLKSTQKISVKNKVWEEIDFGFVTIER